VIVEPILFFGTQREWAAHADQLRGPIEAALASGRWLQGEPVAAFERELAARCRRAHAVSVGSGTDALFFALRALGLGQGDEILVPDFSFVATATAIVRAGARPVWADVDEDGLLDLGDAAARVGPRTAAVIAVSLFGRPLDAAAAEAFADRHGLALIEDAAQALGASAHGRPAGAVGVAASVSFDPTKPIAAPGSGGAVLTDDDALARACRRLRCHGSEDGGSSATLGYNSRLPTISAAALLIKLSLEPSWRARRTSVAEAYDAAVESVEGLTPPGRPVGGAHAYSKYVVRVDGGHQDRAALAAALERAGVTTQVHYRLPLHAHPVFADCPPAGEAPPLATALTQRVLSLPIHPFLRADEVRRVTCALTAAPPRPARPT